MSVATATQDLNQVHGLEGTDNPGPAPKRIVTGYGFWIFILSDMVMFSCFFAAFAVLSGQTVVVQQGRITAIGPFSSTPVPAGATAIQGQGRYLMPGLADMHVHLEGRDNFGDAPLFVTYGITTVMNLRDVLKSGMEGRCLRMAWVRCLLR